MLRCLYLAHGWSYDASFWTAMLHQLPGFRAVIIDFGYNGAPSFPPPPQEPYLAVGHSTGVLSLLAQDSPLCRGMLSINGFARFSQAASFPEGIPARFIERMNRRLCQDTSSVLHAFRHMCGDNRTPLPHTPDQATLQAGLTTLIQADHRPHLTRWSGKLNSLVGQDDPLSPARSGLPPPARQDTLPGGHVLPLTHPHLCAQHLRAIASHYD
ncbi:biotin synthase [Saccharibacter sp. 17.LH.SD]|uniref:alpha/beta fold hydrolase n=1 Tax=Saccharibacter sp. 17.LH.SD TaxID=2689393 RepID=UPI00136F078B|nr:biotin synthase [Saccharibacter sp. 17.LH.SD]MXV43692.1 biotin synthase [Saccharibacter sp. 17.LH.SD]